MVAGLVDDQHRDHALARLILLDRDLTKEFVGPGFIGPKWIALILLQGDSSTLSWSALGRLSVLRLRRTSECGMEGRAPSVRIREAAPILICLVSSNTGPVGAPPKAEAIRSSAYGRKKSEAPPLGKVRVAGDNGGD